MSALARRMSTQQALALPSPAASNTVMINARCSLRIEAGQRVIIVAGLPVHHYCAEDAVAETYAMVFLVESGFAQQTDVARAFARSVRTVRRYLGAELARLRVDQRGHLMGFLYVDGHVRAYTANAPSHQRLTWRAAIWPCPPAPTTGSTTAPAIRCW